MRVGITLSKSAYTPEAFAYESFLSERGHIVELAYQLNPYNDINIHFMGTRPFWIKNEGRAIDVHEYHSLSTPPYPYIKNNLKKLINVRPAGRIFLNQVVYENFRFRDNIPFIYRDMGVDESLFQSPSSSPQYDIVYCGSVAGRGELTEVLLNLSKSYKIIVVGIIGDDESRLLCNKNITLFGRASRDEIKEIYRNARFGLNYTPNLYPYNIQTSTKTLEYLASGLHVISNEYAWIKNFSKKINYDPIWLINKENLQIPSPLKPIPDLSDYSWNNILLNSNFENFLKNLLRNR